MKAISVKFGWANLIRLGQKTIETRTWRTNYRGPLLICATRPEGLALCVVDVVDCRPACPSDEQAACDHVAPGEFAWVLANVRPVNPFPVKGRLGLYEVSIPA